MSEQGWSRGRRGSWRGAIVILTWIAASARAAPPQPDGLDDTVKQLTRLSERNPAVEQCADLATEFEKARTVASRRDLTYKLALCHEELGYHVEAIGYYRAYAKTANLKPDERAAIEQKLNALLPHVGKLTVETNIPGAAIFVDRRLVGTTPLSAFLVEAGTRRVAARQHGYLIAGETIVVEGGTVSPTLKLTLIPITAAQKTAKETKR